MPRKRFRSIPRPEMIEPRLRLKDEHAVLAALTHTSNRWKVANKQVGREKRQSVVSPAPVRERIAGRLFGREYGRLLAA